MSEPTCCEVPATHRRYGAPRPCIEPVELAVGIDLDQIYCACGHTATCHLRERIESGEPALGPPMLYCVSSPRSRRAWLTRYGGRQWPEPTQWRLWLEVAMGVLYAATGAADVVASCARAERPRRRGAA